MRKSGCIAITGTLLSLAFMGAQAQTPSYDTLYVFGDSSCDVGNLFTATGGAEPAAPITAGDFPTARSGWITRLDSFCTSDARACICQIDIALQMHSLWLTLDPHLTPNRRFAVGKFFQLETTQSICNDLNWIWISRIKQILY
jgi:hypothetical protein